MVEVKGAELQLIGSVYTIEYTIEHLYFSVYIVVLSHADTH